MSIMNNFTGARSDNVEVSEVMSQKERGDFKLIKSGFCW